MVWAVIELMFIKSGIVEGRNVIASLDQLKLYAGFFVSEGAFQ